MAVVPEELQVAQRRVQLGRWQPLDSFVELLSVSHWVRTLQQTQPLGGSAGELTVEDRRASLKIEGGGVEVTGDHSRVLAHPAEKPAP